MGEVFRARDTRLGRDVAIKILPRAFTDDPDRLARFEREARVLAALNHPNIATIHGVQEGEGVHALVMELVDGQTLGARIERGPIPMAEALAIARQIADALEAAHDKGIIHRDLKPANIKITPAGLVKVLDFGLAKLTQASGPDVPEASQAPTITVGGTKEGLIVGTAAYMSPEQARGQVVDKQTDIWAFGCVLYEMITGAPPFSAGSMSDTIARILEREPDWQKLPATTPAAIRRLLRRCLAKDRRRRSSGAADVRIELDEPDEDLLTSAGASGHPWMRRRGSLAVAGALFAAAAIVTAWFVMRGAPPAATARLQTAPAPTTHATIDLPANAPLVALGVQIPANGWNRPVLALSPDGAHLAYVGWNGSETILYLRDLSGTTVRPVAGSEGAIFPFFSPDSQWLGFLTNDKVRKISLSGGPVITLCDASVPVQAWWRGDVIFFDQNEGALLSKVSAEGGPANAVVTTAAVVAAVGRTGRRLFSDVLPDGRSALMTVWAHEGNSADYAQVELVALHTMKAQVVAGPGYGARYVDPGYVVFARAGSLHGIPFTPANGRAEDAPTAIVAGAAMESIWGLVHATVSSSGVLAYVPGGDLSVGQLAWVDRQARTEFVDVPQRVYGGVRLAPDGARVALPVADVTDYIWVWDLHRAEGRRLSSTENNAQPTWSPDSLRLAFRSVRAGAPPRVVIRDADGGGTPRELVAADTITGVHRWSPDARTLGVSYVGGRIEFTRLDGRSEHTVTNMRFPNLWDFAPDGLWLAYTSTETGQFEIWVRSYADDTIARQVSVDGGVEPLWCRCGELFYRRGNQWFSTTISTAPDLRWDSPRPAFATPFIDNVGTSYDVSADGRRLLVVKHTDPPIQTKLHIVTNWFGQIASSRQRQ